MTSSEVLEILTVHRLHYSPQGEQGVLCFGLGALSELGRAGLLAVGSSMGEAEEVYASALEVLDRESGAAAWT